MVNGLLYHPEEAIAVLTKADETLGRVIGMLGPFGLEGRGMASPFRTLLRAIAGQQLSRKAADTIFGRLMALLPEDETLQPQAVLALPDESLRAAGLSRAKTLAIKDLALKTIEGVVPPMQALLEMSDDEIIAHLTKVRGVGRWTVEMLLIFHLGRPDVLPVDDLGLRKGYQIAYGLPELPPPKAVLAYGDRWRPYRSVASWYLWRVLDSGVNIA